MKFGRKGLLAVLLSSTVLLQMSACAQLPHLLSGHNLAPEEVQTQEERAEAETAAGVSAGQSADTAEGNPLSTAAAAEQGGADATAESASESGISGDRVTAGHSPWVDRSGEMPETAYNEEGGFGSLSAAQNFTGDRHLVIVGDSRTVGLYCSQAYDAAEFPSHMFYNMSSEYTGIANNMVFVAKGGEGYDWFAKLGLALAAQYLDKDAVLVVWLGVNDLQKAQQYITYMNGAGLQFGVPVYYMTVGPADGGWADHEADILAMNDALRGGLNPAIGIIDTYTFVKSGLDAGSCHTLDGLHYDYETDRQIVDYMRQVISEDLGGIQL